LRPERIRAQKIAQWKKTLPGTQDLDEKSGLVLFEESIYFFIGVLQSLKTRSASFG